MSFDYVPLIHARGTDFMYWAPPTKPNTGPGLTSVPIFPNVIISLGCYQNYFLKK